MKKCTYCGAQVKDSARFCLMCGKKIVDDPLAKLSHEEDKPLGSDQPKGASASKEDPAVEENTANNLDESVEQSLVNNDEHTGINAVQSEDDDRSASPDNIDEEHPEILATPSESEADSPADEASPEDDAKSAQEDLLDLLEQEADLHRQHSQKPRRKVRGSAIAIISAIALVAAALCLWFCLSHFSPLNMLVRAIDDGDIARTEEIYSRHISGNDAREAKLTQQIPELMEAIIADYQAGEIKIKDAKASLACIEALGFSDEYEEAVSRIEALKVSAANYESALQAWDKQEYEQVISYCELVIEDDRHYQDAQDLAEQAKAAHQDFLIAAAEELLGMSDYGGALEMIAQAEQLYGKNDTLTEAQSLFHHQIEEDVLAKAEEAAKKEDYDEAVAVIEEGLTYLPDNEKLVEKRYVYASYTPTLLTKMEIAEYTGDDSLLHCVNTNVYLTDSQGTLYTSSLYATSGTVTIVLNKCYGRFKGTVAFPKGADSDKFRTSAELKIYGDDKLLYRSGEMDETSQPQQFNVEVGDYKYLKLEWKCNGLSIWKNWGYFTTIFDGKLYPHAADK